MSLGPQSACYLQPGFLCGAQQACSFKVSGHFDKWLTQASWASAEGMQGMGPGAGQVSGKGPLGICRTIYWEPASSCWTGLHQGAVSRSTAGAEQAGEPQGGWCLVTLLLVRHFPVGLEGS